MMRNHKFKTKDLVQLITATTGLVVALTSLYREIKKSINKKED